MFAPHHRIMLLILFLSLIASGAGFPNAEAIAYQNGGIDTTFTIHSKVLGEERTILIGLTDPPVFDAYIASSPMLGHISEYIFERAGGFLEGHREMDCFLFMIYGDRDSPDVTRFVPDFVSLLEERAPEGLKWVQRIVPGEGHVPPTSLREGLLAIFPTP